MNREFFVNRREDANKEVATCIKIIVRQCEKKTIVWYVLICIMCAK